MKKHRKLVALLVALTFLFSVVAPVMAATPSQAEKSADKLNVLGIIEGYPDGTFGLDRNITRAEFAKIAVASAGLTEAAEQLVNFPSQFSDVKVGEWYTGWINMAASQGFVKGDPAGTFRPNDNITYAEVVTVLVRLLGYNDNLTGPWPTNYLAKAVELDITEGVAINASAPAVRGDVFVMTDNTLDCNTVIWSTDKLTWLVNEDEKLIVKSFKGRMHEGLVADISWDVKGGISLKIVKEDGSSYGDIKLVDNVIVSGAEDPYGLLGKQVEFIRNEKSSGADRSSIVYLGVKDTDVVSKDSVKYYKDDYIEVDKKKYDLAKKFGVTFFPVEDEWENDGEQKADKIEVVINEDGDAQWAFVYNFSKVEADIIDEITDSRVYGVSKSRYDYDAKKVHVIIKDGVIADYDALAEGDLIYTVKEAKNTDYLVIAVSEVLEGELEKANEKGTELTIDGKKIKTEGNYLISLDNGDSFEGALDDVLGEKIKYMLSPAGLIAAIISDVEGGQKLYGLVETTLETARGWETRILTADGSKVVYHVDSDYVKEWRTATSQVPVLVEYSLDKNGRIDYVQVAEKVQFNDYDGNRAQLGSTWYRVDSNAAFFGEDANGKNVASDWDTFKKITKGNADPFIYVLKPKGAVKAMYVEATITGKDNVGVIADTGRDKNGFYYEIFFEGEKVRYNLTKAAEENLPKLEKGTLVEFILASGKISHIEEATANKVSEPTRVEEASTTFVRIGDNDYFYIDEDTMIVDVTESTKKLVGRVGRGDYVLIHAGDKDIIEVIVITNEFTQETAIKKADSAIKALEAAADKDLTEEAALVAAENAVAAAQAALNLVHAGDKKNELQAKFDQAKQKVEDARAAFDKAVSEKEAAAVLAVVDAVTLKREAALAAALDSDYFKNVVTANMAAYLASAEFGALNENSTVQDVNDAIDAVNEAEKEKAAQAAAVLAVVDAVKLKREAALAAALDSDYFKNVVTANMAAYLASTEFGTLGVNSTVQDVNEAIDAVNDQAAVDAAVAAIKAEDFNGVKIAAADVADGAKRIAAVKAAVQAILDTLDNGVTIDKVDEDTFDNVGNTGEYTVSVEKNDASEDVKITVVFEVK